MPTQIFNSGLGRDIKRVTRMTLVENFNILILRLAELKRIQPSASFN